MCGIGAIFDPSGARRPELPGWLALMNELQKHRGPDDEGTWVHAERAVGFAHRRLDVIDHVTGSQPMTDGDGNWLSFNGEIYNYRELRDFLGRSRFRTSSDTEVILHAYRRMGVDCLEELRGMFGFTLWDEERQTLLVARDPFGIKPMYYTVVDGVFACASEAKALVPFVPEIDTDPDALCDYLTFQFPLAGATLFRGIRELPPGHYLTVKQGPPSVRRYWEVQYEPDFDHTPAYFTKHLRELVEDSVQMHLRADVPIGAYVSGGLDSGIVASAAAREQGSGMLGFTGRFAEGPAFDESAYARAVARDGAMQLHETTIDVDDFARHIGDVVYHLDYPIAGPGSFPQYLVARLAAQHRKVVLGGQGGDEIFGGYARYLLAYFEQCIKSAIDGTMHNGSFVVTYESIIPNLASLRPYKPLMQEFWRDGLFGDLDARYFRLVNRAPSLDGMIDRGLLQTSSPEDRFRAVFRAGNVRKESYFDAMTHFDFKTLLPALLQVEDRVSMAHGLESRVPFLDRPLVDFAATMPADVKFKDGMLKHALKQAFGELLPAELTRRTDKMGFPVPLHQWAAGPLRDFLLDTLGSAAARSRPYLAPGFDPVSLLDRERPYGRGLWALLSLELWQQRFHDASAQWRAMARTASVESA